jgi:uncharacterized protein
VGSSGAGHARLGMRAWLGRLLFVSALSAGALVLLFPQGRLALRVDATPAALGHPAAPEQTTEQLIVAGFSAGRAGVAEMLAVTQLEQRLREIEGVTATRSAASVQLPYVAGSDITLLSLARLLQAVSPAQAAVDRVLDDPLIAGHLAAEGGRALAIIVDIRGDAATRQAAAERIVEQVRAEAHGVLRWEVTGASVVSKRIGTLLLRQMSIVLPVAILMFSLMVLLVFRQALAVIGCLASIAAAVLWTLAAAVALDWPLNLVTIIIPALVLTLTVSCTLHVVSAHADSGSIKVGLENIRWAVVYSTATTVIGIGALGLSELPSVRQFAALGVIGTVCAALSSWTVLPLVMQMARRPPQLWPPVHDRLLRLARVLVALVVAHSQRVIRAALLLLVLGLAAATLVRPGARYVEDLPATEPVRLAYEEIGAAFGGTNPIFIEIVGSAPDAMIAPTVLRAVDELSDWLRRQPEIGEVRSAVDYLKRLNQDFVGQGARDHYRLPDSADLSRQLIYFAAPDDIYRYTNRSFSRMRIEARTQLSDTQELAQLLAMIERRLQQLPPGLAVELGGSAVELTRTVAGITDGQLRSLGISALGIFIVLTLLFASPRVGAMALLPNALPVVAYFALLGITGTPLSPTTALLACIVLGIAVDDTLHLLTRFNALARKTADEAQASRTAVAEVMRPITLTTIACCLGFLTLATSPFHSHVVFGLLAALTLALAWIMDLLITPAVSARSSIVTLWDHLRLDLGADPVKTIPMMADMSQRQARQFALNGTIRSVRTGQDLIRQGEAAGEMFVVIEGAFRVWMRSKSGQAHDVARAGRGATLGETGHFAHERAATVTAVEDARVLVLDAEVLERLRVRHPRVAALAYRNLNRIQAERTLQASAGQARDPGAGSSMEAGRGPPDAEAAADRLPGPR